ncbi:MAG: DUF6288 domain-containing protein [Akkermansiaceae bacterium]|nr:DUF6288 domain-containing protein [Akkermansiaceae bacterium]
MIVGLAASACWTEAALLPDPIPEREPGWPLPGGVDGWLVEAEKSWTARLAVPPLTEKEAGLEGEWRLALSADVYGSADGKPAKIRFEAIDPASGEVFASSESAVSVAAPTAPWSVIFSSEQPGSAAELMFDGDPGTDWHSRYGEGAPQGPHWVGLVFGKATVLEGLRYLPRQGGFTNGVPKQWRVDIRREGGDWEKLASGESDRVTMADQRAAMEVRFEKPLPVQAFRFVVESDWSGGGFGTGAEIEPLGVKLVRPDPQAVLPGAAGRAWLELDPELSQLLIDKTFGLRVVAVEGRTVLGQPRACRLHSKPSPALFGRSNGGTGPDLLGAGLLGFDALTEHGQTALSIMDVRKGSPASKAKLKAGDVVVSVGGRPLPVNDLNPGWEWFHHSHESVLGRSVEEVLAKGGKTLSVGVLRKGVEVTLELELPRTVAFSSLDPATDPEAARMLADMLEWLEENQDENGSWSGDIKRTTLGALAMLATGEPKHRRLAGKAVDWSLEQFPTPEKHGNLGFWGGAYMGILYAEWHLATGDRKVLPHLDAMRDWAYNGRHPSKWEVPALGHGPDGLPYDQKALVAPACHLLVFEALAKRCGMKSKLWEMLMPYMELAWSDPKQGGHGALGYNQSYKDLDEFFSRSGLFAMACDLRGERSDMRDAMAKIMVERHPWLRNSHAYGEPGGSLGLLALNLVKPADYQKVIREYAWWFALAWEPGYGLHFTQPHMGAPYMGEDDLFNVAYALVLQGPKKSLHLTGKDRSAAAD